MNNILRILTIYIRNYYCLYVDRNGEGLLMDEIEPNEFQGQSIYIRSGLTFYWGKGSHNTGIHLYAKENVDSLGNIKKIFNSPEFVDFFSYVSDEAKRTREIIKIPISDIDKKDIPLLYENI